VLKRIQFLAENGLAPMMVLFDFLLKRIAPLQLCAHPAWMYTGENDATQMEHGHGSDLGPIVLNGMLSELSIDPSSGYFINPQASCMPISWTRLRGHCC
jgi:hypothetical protein